jgi:hypothetical protein
MDKRAPDRSGALSRLTGSSALHRFDFDTAARRCSLLTHARWPRLETGPRHQHSCTERYRYGTSAVAPLGLVFSLIAVGY